MNVAERVLTRLFGPPEEINGRGRCPTYLKRWVPIHTQRGSLYIHHFMPRGADWCLDLHDHPKRFTTLMVRGAYTEFFRAASGDLDVREFHAPYLRSFPPEHAHRLVAGPAGAWTIVWVGRPSRDWGFWHRRQWFPFKTYIDSTMADGRVACR